MHEIGRMLLQYARLAAAFPATCTGSIRRRSQMLVAKNGAFYFIFLNILKCFFTSGNSILFFELRVQLSVAFEHCVQRP